MCETDLAVNDHFLWIDHGTTTAVAAVAAAADAPDCDENQPIADLIDTHHGRTGAKIVASTSSWRSRLLYDHHLPSIGTVTAHTQQHNMTPDARFRGGEGLALNDHFLWIDHGCQGRRRRARFRPAM